MRFLRRIQRFLFGDDRYERLVLYAWRRFGREVKEDDEYLKKVVEAHVGRTNLKDAVGGCPPEAGGSIYISPRLQGEDKLFVLIHELGHALDFEDEARRYHWHEIWTHPELTDEDREFILDVEERAYELGKQMIDKLDIDVDEQKWNDHVLRKYGQNVDTYLRIPDVVI